MDDYMTKPIRAPELDRILRLYAKTEADACTHTRTGTILRPIAE
jgi:hypothetical protein